MVIYTAFQDAALGIIQSNYSNEYPHIAHIIQCYTVDNQCKISSIFLAVKLFNAEHF